MEAFAFQRIMAKLSQNNNITRIVNDGDVKIDKLIHQSNWNITLSGDTNHLLKNFHTLFNKYNLKCDKKLTGLESKVLNFLKSTIYENSTTDCKLAKFQNSYLHFIGIHNRCPPHKPIEPWKNSKNQASRQALYELILDCMNIIRDYSPTRTTNYCECFHSVRSRLATKGINWGSGWLGRLSTSILQFNDPDGWLWKALITTNAPALPL